MRAGHCTADHPSDASTVETTVPRGASCRPAKPRAGIGTRATCKATWRPSLPQCPGRLSYRRPDKHGQDLPPQGARNTASVLPRSLGGMRQGGHACRGPAGGFLGIQDPGSSGAPALPPSPRAGQRLGPRCGRVPGAPHHAATAGGRPCPPAPRSPPSSCHARPCGSSTCRAHKAPGTLLGESLVRLPRLAATPSGGPRPSEMQGQCRLKKRGQRSRTAQHAARTGPVGHRHGKEGKW
mmetsp:Transcript_61561/g.198218  ORF Transcript_61561/g.198218 Transcript_61561/m.198218 type:complete len:238 (-) Transcript_61561:67-780(-)